MEYWGTSRVDFPCDIPADPRLWHVDTADDGARARRHKMWGHLPWVATPLQPRPSSLDDFEPAYYCSPIDAALRS